MFRVSISLSICALVAMALLLGPKIPELRAQDRDFRAQNDETAFDDLNNFDTPPQERRPTQTVDGSAQITQDDGRLIQDDGGLIHDDERLIPDNSGRQIYIPALQSNDPFAETQWLSTQLAVQPSTRTNSKTAKAYALLKKAESDEDKKQAEEDLREALSEEYDLSLESHENNLAQLRARLEELEQELAKRRDAKDQLVDLRLQMIVNEVNGLGWPGQNSYYPGSVEQLLFNIREPHPPSSPLSPSHLRSRNRGSR